MSFFLDDAGRKQSRRPSQKRDCTVRALSLVLSIKYDDAYERLRDAGRECSTGFDIERWARKSTAIDGFGDRNYFTLHKMPFDKGDRYGLPKATTRYRLYDFIKDNPSGRFMVSTARHVFAVVDGVVYDDMPWHFMENRPVYAWIEAKVIRLPLWQVYALRRPIKKGGTRMVKRCVAIVEAVSYKLAMKVATKHYEWALRSGEDLSVNSLEQP